MNYNVHYSNNITNTIKNFRENIYCTEEFKKCFSNKLEESVGAVSTSYIPEQFGGWSVNVTTKTDELKKESAQSSEYISTIADVLASSIHNSDKSIHCRDLAANLANVVVTGPNSLIIKL